VTQNAGLAYQHGCDAGQNASKVENQMAAISGGVASGDYDGDGWVDLYILQGQSGPNRLLRNNGNGVFQDVAAAAGVALAADCWSGPTFADFTGDGKLDLFVGGVLGTGPRFFRNQGDGTFEDVTAATGVTIDTASVGASFGDYDRDGDLDFFVTRWGTEPAVGELLKYVWRNNGDGTFTGFGSDIGIDGFLDRGVDRSFAPNFADINSDGWPDFLVTSDFGTSRVFLNDQDGTFTDVTNPAVITDQNGMGAAVVDFDDDGDLDWFVTSIYNASTGKDGNRLYRNPGNGNFSDYTTAAAVRIGYWGWGACAQDFNNDGFVDLLHENGWSTPDAVRLFVNNGNATFTERSQELGLLTVVEARGVSCFDYDRDGDIDVFVAPNNDSSVLYRNEGGNLGNFLQVRLVGTAPNTEAIGARVYGTIGARTQLREIRAGSNYVSQDPAVAHFGLGTATQVDQLQVVWPDQSTTTLNNVSANQFLVVAKP
jgi:hypothetical protein